MSLKYPLVAAVALVASSLVVLSVPSIAGDKLSPSEIRNLAPGRYNVSVLGLVSMTVSMRPNGTITGVADGKKDHGVWSVRGQKLCVAWNKWVGGKQRCASLSGGNGSYSGGGLYLRKI